MSSESDGDDDEFAASLEQAMLAAANPPCRRDSDGSNTALGHTTGALHTDVSTTTHTGDDWAFGLPEEVILHVFKFLSPQDLVAAAKASRCLARASNTPALWRHLFLLRWGQNAVETGSEMEAYVSWKKLYFERDSEEMDRLTRHGDAVLGDIYLKMHISQRSKAPSRAEASSCDVQIVRKASVADLVCRWRLQRSLGDGADMRHACSYKTCTYHQISNSFICERTGRVHECGDMCGERVVDESGMMVCVVSGRCFDAWLEQHADDEVDDEGGQDGPGTLGKAYQSGYYCSTEAELEVALWGGSMRSRSASKASVEALADRFR